MTRINCGIPPAELTDKHLLAEHREIKRIPNTIKSGKAVIKDIPETFTLGRGHVKFFYDKLRYIHGRYLALYSECKKRNFNVTFYSDSFKSLPIELYNNYQPTDRDRQIIRERIKERLTQNQNHENRIN